LSVESVDVVVEEFPDDDGFVSGSGDEKGGVFSVFGGVASLETGDPVAVTG